MGEDGIFGRMEFLDTLISSRPVKSKRGSHAGFFDLILPGPPENPARYRALGIDFPWKAKGFRVVGGVNIRHCRAKLPPS